jgi:uncharacterized delta-60 repeat protein
MLKLLPSLLLSAALSVSGIAANAQSLPFDSTFGVNGIADLDFLPAYHVIDITTQRDGKILCLYGNNSYTYVIRLNANGTVDNTFMGGDGYKFYSPFPTAVPGVWQIGGKICELNASLIKQASDDGIFLGFRGFSTFKLKPNGDIDLSFGNATPTNGNLNLTSGSSPFKPDFLYDMYDAGEAGLYFISNTRALTSTCDTLLLAKTTKNGQLISTFGTGGIKAIPLDTTIFGFSNLTYECVFAPDGKLVVAGRSYRRSHLANRHDAFVARYNTDGTPDASFGTGGVAFIDIDNEDQYTGNIAIGFDGSVYISGTSSSRRYFTTHLTATGVPDASFGTGGTVLSTTAMSANSWSPAATAVTSYGKVYTSCVYAVGVMDMRSEYFSYTATGGANTMFAAGGVVNTTGHINNDNYEKPYRMYTQPDNKILIMGAGDTHPLLMRINGDAAPTSIDKLTDAGFKVWVSGQNAYVNGIATGTQASAIITTIDGRILKTYNAANLAGNGTTILPLPDDLATGLYILSVQTETGKQQIKFVY